MVLRLRKDDRLTLRVPALLKAKLLAEARRQDRSVAWLVEKYLEAGLKSDRQKSDKGQ